ncbi:MAG: NYN domain-containing protein [Proteobacteria bacterium]|nr:NYN domain-containing protein [Pseudomonadota bacterium]
MNDTKEAQNSLDNIIISQSVAILIDGNNIERSIHAEANDTNTMLNFDALIPKLLLNRGLSRLVYFREGKHISNKLQERLHNFYHGSVRPCHKSADIPLSINAIQVADKVDTIIIMSGDADYIDLVRHLKSEGVRVEIAAVESTTSKLIKDEADHFHEITKEDWFTLPTKKSQKRRSKK